MSYVTQPTPQPQSYPPPSGYYVNTPPQPPKRGMSTIAILAIVGGIMLALCIVGGTIVTLTGKGADRTPRAQPTLPTGGGTPAATTPAAKVVPLGQALTFAALGNEVVYVVNPGPKLTKTKFGTGPEKGTFFAVSAAIEVKKGTTYACSCDVALVTKDGTVYEPSVTYGFDGALDAVQLNAGQKAAGLIVWDLPAAAVAGARIELRASIFADADQYWQLP